MNKLVSVIIPTYKRSEFLLRTIDSVLNQTYPNIEIIVVDDNGIGTEFQRKTQEKLQPLIDAGSIIYIPHEINKNGSAARNTGFRASHGEYVNFLDDDDELFPLKIEKQVATLETCSDKYGATYCNKRSVFVKSIVNKVVSCDTNYTQEGKIMLEYLLAICTFGTSQILFRREIISRLNGFDDSYIRHQDVELMTRFFDFSEIKATKSDKPLVIYDMVKDRGNELNCEKDFFIKDKYLDEFKEILSRNNIYIKVKHHFWYLCSCNSLRACNYKIAKKALRLAYKDGYFSLKELVTLSKRTLVGIIAKLLNK